MATEKTTRVGRGATPMLAIRGAAKAISFYKAAFGAVENKGERVPHEGKVGHAEIEIQGARVMLADEFPEHNASPATLGGSSVIIHVWVDDVDAIVKRASAAGAEVLRAPADQPYGRVAKLRDPFGHVWMFNAPV